MATSPKTCPSCDSRPVEGKSSLCLACTIAVASKNICPLCGAQQTKKDFDTHVGNDEVCTGTWPVSDPDAELAAIIGDLGLSSEAMTAGLAEGDDTTSDLSD